LTEPSGTGPDTPAAEPAPEAGDDAGGGADLARRRFFRQFAGEVFQGAAAAVGAAQALQRVSAEAANAILDPKLFAPVDEPAGPPTGFRAAFR
jgi:hypothetical protein